jgi:IMP dehydrogenase
MDLIEVKESCSNVNIDSLSIKDSVSIPKKNRILIEEIQIGLTFDDVLLLPQYSNITSRRDVSLKTRFSKNVKLNMPLVSSPMDTVTESEMAIEMARNGGIGIIHRFQSIEDQAKMIRKVKRSEAHVIMDPIRVNKNITLKKLKELIKIHNINTFLVTDDGEESDGIYRSPQTRRKGSFTKSKDTLAGIITSRDMRFHKDDYQYARDIMTPRDKMVVWVGSQEQYPSISTLKDLMIKNRIEKIPIVTEKNEIIGLVALKDILRLDDRNYIANLDDEGSLIVGAAIGAKDDYLDRAKILIDAGCDVLVVDIANGHSQLCIDTVSMLKEKFNIDVVAGSIATGEGALNLIKAGADGIRCGIGNGSICITRIVAGSGVPQLSALIDVAPVCKEYNIPLISDGGNRNSGNMCKALAAGADCIMLGRLVAGCEESPSKVIYRDGKLCKVYRGMAGYGANVSKAQRIGDQEPNNKTFTPEGVEGFIPYAGPLKDVLHQFESGIKSGMSYSGARSIVELQSKAKFIRMTSSGLHESGVHDINKI